MISWVASILLGSVELFIARTNEFDFCGQVMIIRYLLWREFCFRPYFVEDIGSPAANTGLSERGGGRWGQYCKAIIYREANISIVFDRSWNLSILELVGPAIFSVRIRLLFRDRFTNGFRINLKLGLRLGRL